MSDGKRKRGQMKDFDFYHESKQIMHNINHRERILFFHRSISLIAFTLMWVAYFNRFGADGPYPVQEIMLTVGMLLIYFNHSRYVFTRNRNEQHLGEKLLHIFKDTYEESDETVTPPHYDGRLIDESIEPYDRDEEYNPNWQYNGKQG